MLKGQTHECDRCAKEFTVEGGDTVWKFAGGGYKPTEESEKLIEELCPKCCEGFCTWLYEPRAAKSKK